MKSNNAAIQALIQDFADKLDTLIRAEIIRTMAHIVGDGGSVPSKFKAPQAATGRGAKRSPDELEALTKRLLAHITKNPGQRIEQIGAGMGVTTKSLNLCVKKLAAEKLIATKGQKRATSYYPKKG